MYLPDAIARYAAPDGRLYLLTANEGDTRAWTGFNGEARVSELRLDPRNYPSAQELQRDGEMGRLRVTNAQGDEDGDGDYDVLYMFGARSFSVWTADVDQVYDSGNDFEVVSALNPTASFNVSSTDNALDSRSDDKGPEPEAVALGTVRGKPYVFIGNERQSNILVYDLTEPRNPRYLGQFSNRNPQAATSTPNAGDLGPEGVILVVADRLTAVGQADDRPRHEGGDTTVSGPDDPSRAPAEAFHRAAPCHACLSQCCRCE